MTRQLEPARDLILLRVIVTEPVSREKVQAAEKLIARRTGKDASVSVRQVASEDELAVLRERFLAPPPVAAPSTDLNAMREELALRVDQPLREIWPGEPDSLLSWEAGFNKEETVLRIKYRLEKPLDAAAESILAKVMQSRLEVDRLRLVLENETPEAQSPRGRRPRR